MNTDAFQKFSTKYGLDSEKVASFCESFSTHVDLPKERRFKYHPPIKEETKEQVKAKEETILYNVDPVVPTSYIEKRPSPVRMKEHAKASTMVNKSYVRTSKPSEQIKVEPSVAMIKDLLVDNIDEHVITSVMKLLELPNPMKKINIGQLLACLLSQLR